MSTIIATVMEAEVVQETPVGSNVDASDQIWTLGSTIESLVEQLNNLQEEITMTHDRTVAGSVSMELHTRFERVFGPVHRAYVNLLSARKEFGELQAEIAG